jgi:hypothetical protein
MKRDYTSGTAEAVTFFVGDEIERTPAYGMKTLFVVGVHEPQDILDLLRTKLAYSVVTHIYFGANQSFNPTGTNDAATWKPWEDMIYVLLENDYWCTLDLDVRDVEGLLESGLIEKRRFIPQISVKLPYLQQLGYNATIKLDDVDFAATNPGVWCHKLNTLLDETKFTNWDQYGKDEILK